MIYAVIMAGGVGTRFWPLSRAVTPKQLLKITGDKTMIQDTCDRIAPLTSPDKTIVIAGKAHVNQIKQLLPQLPPENVIAEPVGRNTAPCIALAAKIISEKDPRATMGVFPADHLVSDRQAFIDGVRELLKKLDEKPDSLGVIGIKPAYPETGYGYIKLGTKLTSSIYAVSDFMEKPSHETACDYLKTGGYYWNSGMFFWKTSAILEQLAECQPDLMKSMEPISAKADMQETIEKNYPSLPSISIDYGVMEIAGKQGKVIAHLADPGWSDVGSWRSLYDLMKPDADGNRSRGEFVSIDSHGVLVHNENRLVATVGVKDIIVVETPDAILVLNKERAQDVRKIIDQLKSSGKLEYL